MWRHVRDGLGQSVPTSALFALLAALGLTLCSVADPASASPASAEIAAQLLR
ncbi:MAG: hypothetical protein AAGC95_04705 [Pseudomonadota bacterium]